MRDRITLRIVDGTGRTVTTTTVAAYKDTNQQARACQSVLNTHRTRWTHCTTDDRAQWGYEAHDHTGRLISYG